jgi:serpin B
MNPESPKSQPIRLLLVTAALSAGFAVGPAMPGHTDTTEDKAAKRVVAGSNRLGLQVLGKLLEQEPGKNVFLSPSSLANALTMTWTGAAGTTAETMAKLLAIDGLEKADVTAAVKSLLDALARRKGIELRIAQAIWCRSGFDIRDDFVEGVRRSFAADVKTADFADPKTLAAINDWVTEKTGGHIRGALDRIPADALLYLLSAIYFKAQWLEQFDPKATNLQGVFRLIDGSEKRAPMMRRSGKLSAFEDETLKAVRLPYADKKTSMLVLLPKDGSAAGLAALVKHAGAIVAGEDFPAWLSKFKTLQGRLALPRFRIDYGAELKPVLAELGMGDAFDVSKADFTGLRERKDLFVSRVIHKSFVEVNEEGTEAAAVTIVEVKRAAPPKEFEFVADRPFLFLVCDDERGLVLFAGVVLDPGAA